MDMNKVIEMSSYKISATECARKIGIAGSDKNIITKFRNLIEKEGYSLFTKKEGRKRYFEVQKTNLIRPIRVPIDLESNLVNKTVEFLKGLSIEQLRMVEVGIKVFRMSKEKEMKIFV